MTVFYILIFSLIKHKEDRFMLPIIPFVQLMIGYTLHRKVKQWGTCRVQAIIIGSVIVEVCIQAAYSIHHNLHVFTDHMTTGRIHPHSLYTEKRYDQPWHSILHHQNKSTEVTVGF